MTDTTMPLIELLRQHDEGDFLRAVTEAAPIRSACHQGAVPLPDIVERHVAHDADRIGPSDRGCHHQVSKFVNDDDYEWHRFQVGVVLAQALYFLVVGGDFFAAILGQNFITAVHFFNCPCKRC